jgi:phage gp36-like protein
MEYVTEAEFRIFVNSDIVDELLNEYDAGDQTAKIEQVINGAEGMIDGYASKLYLTPLPKSYWVSDLTNKIAAEQLYISMDGNDIPERIKRSAQEARAILQDMMNGFVVPPPGTDGTAVTTVGAGVGISLASDTAVFDYDSMEGF